MWNFNVRISGNAKQCYIPEREQRFGLCVHHATEINTLMQEKEVLIVKSLTFADLTVTYCFHRAFIRSTLHHYFFFDI